MYKRFGLLFLKIDECPYDFDHFWLEMLSARLWSLMKMTNVCNGTVRYVTVQYDTACMVRCGTVRYGTVRYCTVRYGTVRYVTAWYQGNPQRYHWNAQRYHGNPQRYHGNPQRYRGNPQQCFHSLHHSSIFSVTLNWGAASLFALRTWMNGEPSSVLVWFFNYSRGSEATSESGVIFSCGLA